MKLLLIRLSSMGDIVQATAILPLIKSSQPNSQITFITSAEFQDLLVDHPLIDHVFLYDRIKNKGWYQLKEMIAQLHSQLQFDLIIDLHNSMRTKLSLIFIPRIPRLVFPKRRMTKILLTVFKLKRFFTASSHPNLIIDYFSTFFSPDSISSISKELKNKTYAKNDDSSRLTSLPYNEDFFKLLTQKCNLKSPYIVLAPSATYENKRWSIHHFIELINLLLSQIDLANFNFVVLAGPKDDFCQKITQNPRVINLQGKTNIKETVHIIANAHCCVGNDSGLTHIAEAFAVKSLVIFGPTVTQFGFAPHLDRSKVIESDVWCRPCSHLGNTKCFRKRRYCLDDISPRQMLHEILLGVTN